jgi:hypothetical protein
VFPSALSDARVDSLELRCGGLTQSFTREDGSVFVARAPQGIIPDQAGIAGLADTLVRLRAEAWVSDTDVDGAFGTKDSECSATFGTREEGGAMTHVLSLGHTTTGGAFARADDNPNVMLLTTAVSDLLHAVYMDLDTARPHGAVTRLVLTRGGKTVELVRGDETGEAFAEAELLAFDRAVRFGPPGKEEGFDAPWLTIDIESRPDGGAVTKRRVSIGSHPSKTMLARVDGVPATYSFPAPRIGALVDASAVLVLEHRDADGGTSGRDGGESAQDAGAKLR